MRTPKILFAPAHFLYEENKRGTEFQHVFEIVDPLATRWPESVVITGKKDEDLKTNYEVHEVQPHKTMQDSNILSGTLFSIKIFFATAKYLRKYSFDALHHVRPFNIDKTVNIAAILKLNKAKPFIIGAFCAPYAEQQGSIIYQFVGVLLKTLSTKTLLRADRVVVYEEYTKNLVLSRGVEDARVVIIPPGLDISMYSTSFKKGRKLTVISVARLVARKQFDKLLYAFQIVSAKYPDVELVIIGDGPERKKIESLITELNLQTKVKMLGFIENNRLPQIYKEADIFALIQKEESFGFVYLEAMASGLPVVTSENIGSKAIIKPDFGILVDPDDQATFADGLIKLISDEETRKKFSVNARKNFAKNYNARVLSQRYLDLYEDLLKDKH